MQSEHLRLITKALLLAVPILGVPLAFILHLETKLAGVGTEVLATLEKGVKYEQFFHREKKDYSVIIAGDSRAERQLDPRRLQRLTGKEAVNVACASCDLVRTYTLLKIFNQLGKGRIFLISASSFQANDAANAHGYLSFAMLARMSFWERLRIYGRRYYTNMNAALNYYYTPREFLNAVQNENLAPELVRSRGWLAVADGSPTCEGIQIKTRSSSHAWYKGVRFNGARWRVLQEIIAEYAHTDDFFIFFNPPASRAWLDCTRGTFIDLAEREFSAKMQEEISRYPNMRFVDLYADPRFADNGYYSDIQHMNSQGAQRLTEFFSDLVSRR